MGCCGGGSTPHQAFTHTLAGSGFLPPAFRARSFSALFENLNFDPKWAKVRPVLGRHSHSNTCGKWGHALTSSTMAMNTCTTPMTGLFSRPGSLGAFVNILDLSPAKWGPLICCLVVGTESPLFIYWGRDLVDFLSVSCAVLHLQCKRCNSSFVANGVKTQQNKYFYIVIFSCQCCLLRKKR